MSATASPPYENRKIQPSRDKHSGEVTFEQAVRVTPRQPEKTQERPSTGCPKCGSHEPWGVSSWCPACGYYPTLHTTVQVEPLPGAPSENAGEEVTSIADMLKTVPAWGWVLGAGVVGIFVLSIVARLTVVGPVVPVGVWALLQLVLGLAVALVGHFAAYLHGMTTSSKFGPPDILMKPIAIWQPTVRELPKHAWRVWCLAWGLTAAFCAVVVIGGLNYSAIFEDWGAEKRAAGNLVQAITDQARQEREGGADSLEEAINDFAGEGEDEKEKEDALAGLQTADCLIFGYTTHGKDADDPFSVLLLASMIEGQIKFVATLQAHELPQEAQDRLNQRMHTLVRKSSFVQVAQGSLLAKEAYWLQPILMCQVGFKSWTSAQKLKDPVFKSLLADAAVRK